MEQILVPPPASLAPAKVSCQGAFFFVMMFHPFFQKSRKCPPRGRQNKTTCFLLILHHSYQRNQKHFARVYFKKKKKNMYDGNPSFLSTNKKCCQRGNTCHKSVFWLVSIMLIKTIKNISYQGALI